MTDRRILLHVCCATCAVGALERLRGMSYNVTLFFSNSNIYPFEEHERRLNDVVRLALETHTTISTDEYRHDEWLSRIKGLEDEPEKGLRCSKCFEFNLAAAARHARQEEIRQFTTTLTTSPHKVSDQVFGAGANFPRFVPFDFKSYGGFQRGLRLSHKYGFYRQNYCGCEFSMPGRRDMPGGQSRTKSPADVSG